MGFFSLKATCAICGKEVGLNRYLVGKTTRGDCIWKCPQCTRKGGFLCVDYETGKATLLNSDQTCNAEQETPVKSTVQGEKNKKKKRKRVLFNEKIIIALIIAVMILIAVLSGFDSDVMTALYVICFVVAASCFYALIAGCRDKTLSAKHKKVLLTVAVLAVVLFIIFLALTVSNSNGGSSNSWDDLTDEEKEWYHDNYGNGQYDKYQDAINDYKKE